MRLLGNFSRRSLFTLTIPVAFLAAEQTFGNDIREPTSPTMYSTSTPPRPDDRLIGEESIAKLPNLNQSLSRGQWSSACFTATSILAQKQSEIDALGVFALCAALRDDKQATEAALKRLNEAEAPPYYYAQLTRGISNLKDGSLDKASSAFTTVIRQRSGDALGFYFAGETLHAQHRDVEAISAFKSSLAIWPEYAPSLSAIARLSTSGSVSREALRSAIDLADRATKIEPTNLAYWGQLADLCERAGDHGRANAIKLQWLTRRVPK